MAEEKKWTEKKWADYTPEEKRLITMNRWQGEHGGEVRIITPSGIEFTSCPPVAGAIMPIGDDLTMGPDESWDDFFKRAENVLATRYD